jgi:hypothetical protein
MQWNFNVTGLYEIYYLQLHLQLNHITVTRLKVINMDKVNRHRKTTKKIQLS